MMKATERTWLSFKLKKGEGEKLEKILERSGMGFSQFMHSCIENSFNQLLELDEYYEMLKEQNNLRYLSKGGFENYQCSKFMKSANDEMKKFINELSNKK